MKGNFHVRFGERGGETRWLESQKVRSAPTLRAPRGAIKQYLKGKETIRIDSSMPQYC